MPFAFLKPCT